eukprot:CAMPEP_0176489026 /NCGR_PEP_ID=MMETSP0200_2-20121128/7049_1 /TAXON_ID=947934 /ORGANISM="Chaetoceros sp., Strain GSL56" /LENGTH=176 /DNA_ID=CAMNT_0017886101 /DNA_START=94 /DNA_END=621 /DNA_ORIENTATION=-
MDETIVGFKSQARYTSVDRRAQMALDAEESRKELYLCKEPKIQNDIAIVLLMMCTYMHYLLEDTEESNSHEIVEVNEYINESRNNINNDLLQEIIAEFDLVQNYEPPAATGGTIDIDSIFDNYLYAQKDDDSMGDYLLSLDQGGANEYINNIMNDINSITGIGNCDGIPTSFKEDW